MSRTIFHKVSSSRIHLTAIWKDYLNWLPTSNAPDTIPLLKRYLLKDILITDKKIELNKIYFFNK